MRVILMVAITVILAAVIVSFVLGLGDTNSTAPSMTFDSEYDDSGSTDGNVTVTMTGGESFDPTRVSFAGSNLGQTGTFDSSGGSGESPTDADSTTDNSWAEITSKSGGNFGDSVDTVQAGDSITLRLAVDQNGNDLTAGTIRSGFELDIIFISEDGGTLSTIGGTSGPEA